MGTLKYSYLFVVLLCSFLLAVNGHSIGPNQRQHALSLFVVSCAKLMYKYFICAYIYFCMQRAGIKSNRQDTVIQPIADGDFEEVMNFKDEPVFRNHYGRRCSSSSWGIYESSCMKWMHLHVFLCMLQEPCMNATDPGTCMWPARYGLSI